MNKTRIKVAVIVIICIVAVSLYYISIDSNKNKIVSLVNNNLDFLNDHVELKNYEKIYELTEIKDIRTYYVGKDEIYIDFYCYGFGIVPSSIYYGFYYVSVDRPLGFQAETLELQPKGKGWSWKQLNGDNFYYTEKIADNWYYYKAGF